MVKRFGRKEDLCIFVTLSFFLGSWHTVGAATVDRWTNNASGSWNTGSNWSVRQPPTATTSLTTITNSGTKTVTIDAGTSSANLSLQKLTVSAPSGSTNTLTMVDLGPLQPLQLSSTLTLDRGGWLRLTNSALVIDGSSGGILNISGGRLDVSGGLVDCSTTTAAKIGTLSGGTGVLNIGNGGEVKLFQVQLGAINGGHGVLTISNGVLDSSSLITLGQTANSTGVVSLAAGSLIATNDLTKVGNLGRGQVSMSGGVARFAFLSLGENTDSSGIIEVTGGQLMVQPRSTNDYLRVGSLGTGELRISGGTHLIGSELHLADGISATGRVYVTGGQLLITNDITAIGRYGYGEMEVANGAVQFTNASVGRHSGSVGILKVQTNGFVTQLDDLSIGRFAGSVGRVYVVGGMLALTNDNVWVGREGTGELVVSNGLMSAQTLLIGVSPDGTNAPSGTVTIAGGTTVISSNLVVGTEGVSSGTLSMTGGELVIQGAVVLRNGGMELNSGTLKADALVVTNSGASAVFNGGLLQVRSIVAANGQPFMVGDGTRQATLELQGGTYSFPSGLIISRNATLSGCGTIIGNITSYGVLSTNCGVVAPSIVAAEKNGNNVRVVFTTSQGVNYSLQSRDSIEGGSWSDVLGGSAAGTGATAALSDTNASSPMRFYRVRTQ